MIGYGEEFWNDWDRGIKKKNELTVSVRSKREWGQKFQKRQKSGKKN